MKKRLLLVPIVLLMALAFPVGALAGGPHDTKVILGSEYTLESGDQLDGDLLVLGGNVTLEVGSTVTGSVFVLGGNVHAHGTIGGDVGILGGNINLGSAAIVEGDVTTFGGNINRHEGSQVLGTVNSSFEFGFDLDMIDFENMANFPDFSWIPRWSPWIGIVWFVFRTLMLAALAVLVVMLWPKAAERAADVIGAEPWISGGIGLLTIIVTPLILLLMVITLVLIPVSIVTVLLLIVAGVFGWIALGTEIGRLMGKAFNREWHPAAAAGIGTLLLTFVVGGVGMISCFAKVIPLLVASVGLGAIFLTRFGSREYVRVGSTGSAEARRLEEGEASLEKKTK